MAGKKTESLTVAIATYNEEGNLAACLDSVADIAGEIVVVDGGSNDKTTDIAKRFGARIIVTDNPPIFHINKQKALDAAKSDWILQLDADEVVPKDLRNEILSVINDQRSKISEESKNHTSLIINRSSINAYYIPRRNYLWGHFMKKGGQYPDYVIRLMRRGKGRFPAKSVHEQIEVEGGVGHLKHPMLHYSFRTRADYWRKANTYTTLTASELARKKVPKTLGNYMYYALWKPFVIFMNIYIRHKGFVDGMAGFEFALYSGMHWAIAYKKYLKMIND